MDSKGLSRLSLGNYPTPVVELTTAVGLKPPQRLWIKRDDFSGMELSGNKTRKLEYALAEAKAQGASVIITAGAIQSNHCRQTAVACRYLGLKPHLVLFGEEGKGQGGNFLIDQSLEAEITYVHPSDYPRYLDLMADLKMAYEAKGETAYTIPIGASNGIGNFGYVEGYREILQWQEGTGTPLDAIVVAVGSGGTYAGLRLGHYLYGRSPGAIKVGADKTRLVGISISSPAADFKARVLAILKESSHYHEALKALNPEFDPAHMLATAEKEVEIVDGFQGAGYAIADSQAVERSQWLAKETGIILDPVYTGKAFHGLMTLLDQGALGSQVLFVHTGGLFGFFGHKEG